ncbi:MAG: Ig-like domain-containing protein, partial [Candidatus Poribacteria bacterium]|nr:Ig-like domain-containing protein [Candidatus Poribacteria bacterium]
ETPLALTAYQITDLSETVNSLTLTFVEATQVDFENTTIDLIGPNNSAIPLTLENNGVDQITASFVSLTQSGLYTLAVTPQDRSGNVAQSAIRYQFRLAIALPAVSSILIDGKPSSTVYVNSGDVTIVATFTEPTGVGLALGDDGSTIIVTNAAGVPVQGVTKPDGTNQLTWTATPLPTDGSADGVYTATITPIDKSGRSGKVVNRQFIYDTQVPRLTSATPITLYQPISYIGSLTQFQLTVEDVGPALLDLEAQTITLAKKDGDAVLGQITHDGANQLFFTLSTPLPTDGSADGAYILTVDLVDKAGNTYQITHDIFYDSQAPRISSVSLGTEEPLALTAYQITDLSESINSLTLTFVEATQVDFANTTIDLIGPNNSAIPLTLENNGVDQVTASFVSLTQSGLYTLSVIPQDKAGNTAQGSVSYPFRVQFEVPGLSVVKANTAAASVQLIQHEIMEISEPVSSFTLEFTDAMRIDFENTGIMLVGPNEQEIPVTQEDDNAQLVVRFVSLTQSGLYTLAVTPQDRSGNVAQSAIRYQVRLAIALPAVSSILIDGKPSSTVYVNSGDVTIVAMFTEPTGVGLALGDDGSTIIVTNAAGVPVQGVTKPDGTNQLTWTATPLPTDGSADGVYTATITPIDKSGRIGTIVNRQFIYDTQVPRISAATPITFHQPISYIRSLTQFQLTVEDVGPALLDLAAQTITLAKKDGDAVLGQITHDGVNQLFFTLSTPLPTDGSADGAYILTIDLVDKAGNTYQTIHDIFYDSQAPRISSVSLETETPLALTAYQITDLSESINSLTLTFVEATQVDFANTTIDLIGPNNSPIPLTLENNGVDQVTASFVSLTQDGLYTLSVIPQDKAGNVAQGAVPYPFRIQFEVPGLSSVKANTTNTSVELTPYEIMEISESVSSFTLEFTDATQIDLMNTRVTLTGPDEQEISVTIEDGESQLVVRFVSLTQNGVYTFAVTPQDKAGNVAQSATQYQFRLDTALPTVSSVLIDGKPGSVVYVRNAVPRIVATITDPIGVGVSLRDGGSTITVTNPEGFSVSGTTSSNGTNQLVWTSIPLPTDGTADGRYAVAITPVDKSGRSGTVINRQFIYDTQAPRITAASPITLHAPVSYIRSGIDEFVLTIEDVGPADLILASQVVALMDAAEKPVSATLTRDELSNQLYLTLSKPFASDGSVDGAYSLNVRLIDKAGNTSISQFSLVYDSKVPQISSVQVNTAGTPTKLVSNEITELAESISTIMIEFAEATRVDFENTQVSLLDPNDQTIPLTREDDGISHMTLSFDDLTQSGQYTLSVTPQDIAGNAAQSSMQFAFNLEFVLPGVESVIIGNTVTLGSGDIAYVNANNLVIVANLLDPAGTGLSFDTITGSALQVATLDNTIVPGRIATNGTDVMVWEPVTLSNDGSSDGRYAVYVTPVDRKGREGNTIYREFVFDTQEPEITEAEPINLSQPVSYISESLTQFRFALQDVGPADLTLDDQKVSLRSQTGSLIPTKLTNDTNNQLYLTLDEPLPLDGSRDGEYTVVIAFSDKAGNVLSVEHPIVYDTQAPTLVSTVPADNAQLTEDITQIQVNLNDQGGSGIDWDVTTVTLVDPNGTEISGELTSNGKTQLILNTNQLVADGRYTIRVQAIDRAGNGSKSVFETDFLLSRLLPAVISTSPSTAPKDEAYTNEKIEEIEVMLETADENHLSTLRLLNSENQEIAGQQHRESNRLIYSLVRPLATDGSEDGVYTIEFTPISASGRTGEVQRLTFTYDTQVPEVEPEAISLIVAEPEVNNSLIEIRVTLTDNQAGIDWENLDKEWLAFERLSPNAAEIAGHLSYETGEQETLIFRLTVPLADDGSADGEYQITITPKDQAGNGDETYEEVFVYDTSPPIIDPNSLLINDAPLLTDIDAEDYPSAISTTGGVVIQASVSDTGLGVDLSRSQIVVRNPNGQEISGTTRQNGVDTISFKSDGLNVEGVYQVTITGIGNDSELLGFVPKGSITTEFLYETTAPTAVLTNDGGKTEFTDEAVPFEGTASDPRGSRPRPQGEGEIPIPASGVWLVEIIGTGPDGQPIEPIPAEDESNAQEQPWSRWSADFLPARSGEYDLDLRVTDKAGNYAVYDVGEVTMSVSFSFRGKTFGWPNPLRHSKNDVAFFSFDLNTSADETVELALYIYDWGGDMVYSKKYTGITLGQRNDTQIKWNLENQAGMPVARGLYVFRLEAVNGAGNRANAVGKILVVD